ncbi:MAG: DUF1838 family protein [Gammaproteobacteria bacterium]|nr:DUF1838 family protein [Gammaproteobacteria bacterium]
MFLQSLLAGNPSATHQLGTPGSAATATPRFASAGAAASLDFSDPYDNLYAFGKIWAGYDEPQVGGFHGLMYGRIGDSRLIPLFGYTGTGVMQSKIDDDGNMWIRGKETGYFTDLASGDILDTWDNPWTGETVKVHNFYNPNMGGMLTAEMPRFAMGAAKDDATLMNEGTHVDQGGVVPFLLPFDSFGDDLLLAWDYAHEYTNPVTKDKWPKAHTGERISPSEHFTFSMSLDQMMDRSEPTCRYMAGFSRLSQWWPWMHMGNHEYRDEVLFGRMWSHKGLPDYGDVPPKVLAYIEKHVPEYLEVPDHWPQVMPKGTWEAYAEEVPPETSAA